MTNKYLTGAYASGYTIAAGVTLLEVLASAYVGGAGVVGVSQTIGNEGSIGGHGVSMSGDAIVYNGSVSFPDARIYSGGYGVEIGGVGRVINYGQILNKGAQFTALPAVSIHGAGFVRNGSGVDASALIQGSGGIYIGGAATVWNYGQIVADNIFNTAVVLADGGSVTNGSGDDTTAVIKGPRGVGVYTAAGTVTNFGTIVSDYARNAIYLAAGGSVVNGDGVDTHALISGAEGVRAYNVAATVTNFGSIVSTGGTLAAVFMNSGGAVTNGSHGDQSAVIEGFTTGVGISGAVGAVANYGTVFGANGAGVRLTAGGSVHNGGGTDAAALIRGVTGVDVDGGATTVANFGTIDGLNGYGVVLRAGGALTNGGGLAQSALIEGYIAVEAKALATVRNFGTVLSTAMGHYGVYLGAGGLLVNGSATNANALIEGSSGVGLEGACVVDNFGTLRGGGDASGYGLYLQTSGSGQVVNGASGHAGALIEGYTGVIATGAVTVTNWGVIDGQGGTAVKFTNKADILAVETGATFIGAVDGGGGTLDLASGTGTITSLLAGGAVKASTSTTTFANFGAVEVGAGASFVVAGNGSISAAQSLIVAGTLTEAGTLTVAGKLTTSGTLAGTGTLALTGGTDNFNTGTSLTIAKVAQSGGVASFNATTITVADVWTQTAATITAPAGDKVSFTGTGDAFAGTFAGAGTVAFTGGTDAITGASLKATSEIINGAAVTLSGAITLTGVLSVTSPNLAIATAGATLSGGGTVALSNLATNTVKGVTSTATLTNGDKITGAGTISNLVLVNQAGGVINANVSTALTLNTGANTIANAGLIECTSTGGLTIAGAVANSGNLTVTKGILAVNGAVSGAGTVKIAGGVADFGSNFTQSVTFSSTTGVLELAKATSYSGAITGFSKTGTTSLDLLDIGFTSGTTKATYSGTTASGVLTVTDGTHTAKIHLTGNYTASTFNVSSDGHGGTTVVDPTAPSGRTPPLLPLVTAMAGFGAKGGGLAGLAIAPARPPSTAELLRPSIV